MNTVACGGGRKFYNSKKFILLLNLSIYLSTYVSIGKKCEVWYDTESFFLRERGHVSGIVEGGWEGGGERDRSSGRENPGSLYAQCRAPHGAGSHDPETIT